MANLPTKVQFNKLPDAIIGLAHGQYLYKVYKCLLMFWRKIILKNPAISAKTSVIKERSENSFQLLLLTFFNYKMQWDLTIQLLLMEYDRIVPRLSHFN